VVAGIALGCGLLFVRALVQSAHVQDDTEALLFSLDGILHCLSAGQWTNCWAAHKWPLLQYLPALPLRWSGGSLVHIGFLLAYLSIAAFVGVLAVTWSTLALLSRLVAAAALLVLSSGLLLHYSNQSFGEALSAFVATAFVASWLQRRGAIAVGALALLTTLSKETAVPLVVLLAAICTIVHRERGTTWGGLAAGLPGPLGLERDPIHPRVSLPDVGGGIAAAPTKPPAPCRGPA
jgi:hypothetical protein